MNELFMDSLVFLLRLVALRDEFPHQERERAAQLLQRFDTLPMLPPPDATHGSDVAVPPSSAVSIRSALEDLVAIFPGGGWDAYGIGVKLKRAHEALRISEVA